MSMRPYSGVGGGKLNQLGHRVRAPWGIEGRVTHSRPVILPLPASIILSTLIAVSRWSWATCARPVGASLTRICQGCKDTPSGNWCDGVSSTPPTSAMSLSAMTSAP
jgi:hypothetical protein